jgi:uncharacterized RDD family membrane protein YckC
VRWAKPNPKKEPFKMTSKKQFLRAIALIMDYFIWYVLLILIQLFYFFTQGGSIQTLIASGGADLYKELISLPHSAFIIAIIFFALLLIYEVLIPLLTNGQSLTKKIIKIQITPTNAKNIVLRGLAKIIIINPLNFLTLILLTLLRHCGLDPQSVVAVNATAWTPDILMFIFALSILITIATKKSLHERISGTVLNTSVK